jgi:hypothetical protein
VPTSRRPPIELRFVDPLSVDPLDDPFPTSRCSGLDLLGNGHEIRNRAAPGSISYRSYVKSSVEPGLESCGRGGRLV